MNELEFNIEVENHLKYYDSIIKEQGKVDSEVRDRIEKILAVGEDKDLSREDFVFMERSSMKMSVLQNDVTKVVSRIKLLYQLSVGLKFKINLPERLEKIMDSVVKSDGTDFCMEESKDGRMNYRSEEMENMISELCDKRVTDDSLADRRALLKKQYDSFMDSMKKSKEKQHGIKETE